MEFVFYNPQSVYINLKFRELRDFLKVTQMISTF